MKIIDQPWIKVEEDLPDHSYYVKVKAENMKGKPFLLAKFENGAWYSDGVLLKDVFEWQVISDPYRRAKKENV